MKKVSNILLIITIFSTINLYAKNLSTDWTLLHNGLGSIIEVYDHEKKSNVIEFSSQSNRDTYINGAKKGKRAWNNRKSKTIQWSFKYNQNYVAIITLATVKGYRNLVYTANDKDFKSYIGLGSHTIKGEWVTITRNLEEDLHRQDPNNRIVAVNGFAIRGDGRITDVHMLKVIKRSIIKSLYNTIQEALLYLRNKNFISDSLRPKEVKSRHINPNSKNKDVPTITLINGNKIFLNLGEKFIDPGVIAKDSNGVPLDVELIGDINESRVDSYPLHYLAIDKNGNATSVTRVVVVMSKDIKKVKVKHNKKRQNNKKEVIAKDINKSKAEDIEKQEKEEIERDELEELYRNEMGKEETDEKENTEKSETQEEIDNIFKNAEGDTQEEKLENIATKLEELMDN